MTIWNAPQQPHGVKTVWDKNNKRWIWVEAHELWYQDLDATGFQWLPLLIANGPLYDYDRAARSRKTLSESEGEPIDGADDAIAIVKSGNSVSPPFRAPSEQFLQGHRA